MKINKKKLFPVLLALLLFAVFAALPALADAPVHESGSVTDPGMPKVPCPVCGFCPHPGGLCIFIWIAIALAIAALAVLTVRTVRKNRAKAAAEKAKNRPRFKSSMLHTRKK